MIVLMLMPSSGSKKMPYLAHVKALAPTWKTLRHLADWMQVGTTPLRWSEMDEFEKERRKFKANLTYVEYQPSIAPTSQEIETPNALQELLQSLSHEPDKEPPMRLFIVEDLSQQVIEILGSRFDIDPLCFREQIDDYVWYNVRDPWAQPTSLMASMKNQQWFTLRNARLRYHKSWQDYESGWLESNTWNVLRRLDNDSSQMNYWDSEGALVSIMRTRTTIWIGKDKRCGNGTVGIMFVDPTTSHGSPLWFDRANWLPTPRPKMDGPPPPAVTQSVSWYKDIVNMTRAFPWFATGDGHEINAQVLAKPVLYTICAEWLVVCDYAKTRLAQIERSIQMPERFFSTNKEDTPRKRLHTWRRQVPIFREMVIDTLEQGLPAAARLTSRRPGASTTNSASSPMDRRSIMTELNFDELKGYEDIVPDFKRVLAAINDLQERVDRLTDIVVAEISIQDTQRSLIEAHNSARLTWLATIFVPLSLISSVYSMTEDISTLKHTVKWYFVTAIPTTVIVMGLVWMIQKIKSGPKATTRVDQEELEDRYYKRGLKGPRLRRG
jgi:hypothetical protein